MRSAFGVSHSEISKTGVKPNKRALVLIRTHGKGGLADMNTRNKQATVRTPAGVYNARRNAGTWSTRVKARDMYGPIDVSKRGTVPDWMTAALPGSTVSAYNNSTKQKYEAAGKNLGSKIMGGAAGSVVGLGAMAIAGRKIPALNRATKIGRVTLSPDKKKGWAQATAMGVGGGIGGTYMGNRSLRRIKRDKQYDYRRPA